MMSQKIMIVRSLHYSFKIIRSCLHYTNVNNDRCYKSGLATKCTNLTNLFKITPPPQVKICSFTQCLILPPL